MATRMCDVCGVRPARVTIRRIVPGGQPRIEHLCEIHAAEARGQRPTLGGPWLGGGSIFDDFFSRFLDAPEGGMSSPTRRSTPSRGAEQVDITQFFSDSTSALLPRAGQRAGEWGSINLDDEHLLHAALEDGVVRRVVEEVDANPDQIRAQIEEVAERDGRVEASPELSPEAKRALLAAYEESRALGASYIGPEHVLLALTRDEESEAGKLLSRFGLSHTKLRGAVTKPQDTRVLEEEVKRLRREKDQAVSAEDFEKAQELKGRIQEGQDRLGAFKAGRRQAAAEVTADDIAEVVSRQTGIPVSQLTQEERERLIHLEEQLHERVIGQEEAVEAVAEAVRRARAGLSDPNRPIGSFLFLGPTGVGKTELARTLAEALFGEEAAMVRIDMSEFQERHTVSRLVGAPPGYVGYEEAGQLTESVRRRPYSVLHPDVFNILLQILDDGRLTDSQGRTVDFKQTVIIMTSNMGAQRIQAHARRDESFEELKDDMMQILKNTLRPEFVNRIDEVIVFRSLGKEQIGEIARLLLDRTTRRLRAQGIEVEFTEGAVGLIAEEGFDPEFGARPLRRTIQRRVDNELASMVLSGSLDPGDRVVVGADGEAGVLTFEVVAGAAAAEPPGEGG